LYSGLLAIIVSVQINEFVRLSELIKIS